MQDAMLTLTGYGTAQITLTATREHLSSSVTISPAPIQYRVVRVGAHENFTGLSCALDVDGHPYCWSRNLYSQTIPHQWFTVAGDTTPVPLALKTALTFDSLAVGFEHACALTHGGDAYCWGDNNVGQSGTGSTDFDWTPTPRLVTGGHHFLNITLADGRSCGAATDGVAYCWGDNSLNDDFGNGAPGDFSTPVVAATGVQLKSIRLDGSSHNAGASCGISTASIATCWGINTLGAAGIGQVSAHVLPPTAVAAPEQLQSVVPGGEHTCGLGVSGQAYCWGNAQGGAITMPDEVRGYPTPLPVSGSTRYLSLAAALYHTCGLAVDRSVWCWGLGFGTTPVRINIPDPVTDLDTSIFTECAVTTKQQAWCCSSATAGPKQVYGGP
jgi:alpha-tubulin suppressor-like RCC1 family protein